MIIVHAFQYSSVAVSYTHLYMFRKSKEEYEKWDQNINTTKTEYLKIGDMQEEDPDLQIHRIRKLSLIHI